MMVCSSVLDLSSHKKSKAIYTLAATGARAAAHFILQRREALFLAMQELQEGFSDIYNSRKTRLGLPPWKESIWTSMIHSSP